MTNTSLQVKEVSFNDDNLIAIQNEQGIYTAVKYITSAFNFSTGQTKRLMQNLSNDEVIQKGVANLRYPSKGGQQETVCILIDFLPLWLAKISITPSMKRSNPKLVEKLIQYQLKAKDVLAAAFLPETAYAPNNEILQQLQTMQAQLNKHGRAMNALTASIEDKKQEVRQLKTSVQVKEETLNRFNRHPVATKRMEIISQLTEMFKFELENNTYRKAFNEIRGMSLSAVREMLGFESIRWQDYSRNVLIHRMNIVPGKIDIPEYDQKVTREWALYLIGTCYIQLYYGNADLIKRRWPSYSYKRMNIPEYVKNIFSVDGVKIAAQYAKEFIVVDSFEEAKERNGKLTLKDYLVAREVVYNALFE